MQKRELGKSALKVSQLCLGGNVFGWTADDATSFQILDAFVEGGGNFIDTADVYSKWVPGHHGGESESVIGKWFKRSGTRQKVVIATKVGMEVAPDRQGLSKGHIMLQAEASLKRLGTDCIDLYQAHKDDETTPLEETLGAFAKLIEQGKVRSIGASNYSAKRLQEALALSEINKLPAYVSLQPQYNLYDRSTYESDLQPICLEHSLGVIPYYSLAAGFLTGKYRSEDDFGGKARGGTVKRYLNERGFSLLAALDKVAAQYQTTPAKVALAWLMTRPGITAPIASATTLAQLRDLLDATNLSLNQHALEQLDH